MSKIKNTKVYKKENEPTLSDYLIGTKDSNGNTKNFSLSAILQLLNSSNGVNNIQFKFSNGLHPTIDFLSAGYFFTNTNTTEVGTFTQLIFNKETLYPIDLTQLFNKLGELQNVIIKLENPSDPNNFLNFTIVSFQNETDYFVFGVEVFNNLYLGELVNDHIYSLYFDINYSISGEYSQVVYFNSENPATATIFSLDNPPVTNDNSLKEDDDNLYIGTDSSNWVYNENTTTYSTKEVPLNSNFNYSGTGTDSGNNKNASIERPGSVGVGNATASNHAMRKDQVETADAIILASANSYTYAGLSTKLDASAYNDRWKGKYASLAFLESAHPIANSGDYAQVDEGSGFDVINYNYDLEDGWIEGGSGSSATNTDMLPEGSGNLYFTTARVLATLLTGISFATGGAIVSTDSVLVAFGKIQKQINDNITSLGLKQNIALNIQAVTSSATVTPTSSNDMVVITAQAVNLTLANPTGTFQQGQSLIIRIKDNGTIRTITFGSNYRIIGSVLPNSTVANKTMYIGIIYNSTDSKWDIVAIKTEN